MPENPPPARRRRGDALLQAIYDAALAELAETGYGQLTMGGIADRAGTGKMPLYRRWPSARELLLDAMRNALGGVVDAAELPDTGGLRGDLLTLLEQTAAIMAGPLGSAMIAVIGERNRHPELMEAVRDELFGLHPRIRAVLQRAAVRGDITTDRVSAHVCLTAPALMIVHQLVQGQPPRHHELAAIVDDVVLPAVGAAP